MMAYFGKMLHVLTKCGKLWNKLASTKTLKVIFIHIITPRW